MRIEEWWEGDPAVVLALAVAFGCLVASWALLVLLAHRLPGGLARDLAAFIPTA